jgi:hypothetical protein
VRRLASPTLRWPTWTICRAPGQRSEARRTSCAAS